MPSNSETGHAVNLENYKNLIQKCGVLANWNPSNVNLIIGTMNTQQSTAKSAYDSYTAALVGAKNPINNNEILFEPLDKLVTRAVNFLNSTTASKQVKKDAKGIADDLRGFNAKRPKNAPPGAEWVSRSHQSYVQRTNKFGELIALLGTVTEYTPNETDLQVTALTTLQTALLNSLQSLEAILAPIDQLYATAMTALYKEEIGVVDTALAAKKYAVALKGAKAIEIKEIMKIKFTRPKKII